MRNTKADQVMVERSGVQMGYDFRGWQRGWSTPYWRLQTQRKNSDRKGWRAWYLAVKTIRLVGVNAVASNVKRRGVQGVIVGGSALPSGADTDDLLRLSCSRRTRDWNGQWRLEEAPKRLTEFVFVKEIFGLFAMAFCAVICDTPFYATLTWTGWK